MINEIVPEDPAQDFYGEKGDHYLSTALPLSQRAGLPVSGIQDILDMGIYLTNAVKTPKNSYALEKSAMEESLPWLERELALFPDVKVIMLMGDVAKKMFNQIAKKHTRKKRHSLRRHIQNPQNAVFHRRYPGNAVLHHNGRKYSHRKIQMHNDRRRHTGNV